MSKAALLTAELLAALAQVPGFTGVYPQGTAAPDKQPTPYLLVRVTGSDLEEVQGVSTAYAKRMTTYEIEAVYSRSATIQDLQTGEHAILVGLGFGKHQNVRPVKQGQIAEQTTEFPDKEEGSLNQSMVVQVGYRYAETY